MFKNHRVQRVAFIYGYFLAAGNNLQSLFLLWMRLTWGHQFILRSLSEPGFGGYVGLIGGILMFIGFCSRPVGLILTLLMILALSSPAHVSIFHEFRALFEPMLLVKAAPYPFLIASLLLFIFGPGRVSVDAWIKRWADNQPKY